MKPLIVNRPVLIVACAVAALLSSAPLHSSSSIVTIEGKQIRVEFNSAMHSRVTAKLDGRNVVLGDFGPSESITVDATEMTDFTLTRHQARSVRDELGSGRQVTLTGTSGQMRKDVLVTVYDEFPQFAFLKVRYTNTGSEGRKVTGWKSNCYSIAAVEGAAEPAFWSLQSGSYEKRPDWVLPLKPGSKQENYLGMNDTDYGGGTPVVDVWRRDVGIAVGHIELVPKQVSMPVAMPDSKHATVGLGFRVSEVLNPGATIETFTSFVSVHKGDYFQSLKAYSSIMKKRGIKIEPAPASAFEPIWCAWGYGRAFTPAQVDGALPVVKRLGFTWVGVDDGWQTLDGDWGLVPTKFPNGDADMKAIVDRIHAQGFRAQIWWAPLAVKPESELLKSHPEQVLLNADGSKQKISYWDDWYLCPADPNVIEHHRRLVVKMMKEWGYDGLKLDGQHMNAVPPCYNPAHKHARPEDSVEGLHKFFQVIYETAKSIKPDAVVEWCPCGTAYNFYTLPHLNMSVASDPHNSWQIRTKGKTLKALHGDALAYFGDHVEMSDGHLDFAATLGIGGVVGTNFTWPVGSAQRNRLDLTPEKEQVFQKWITLYREKMLSRGEYLGGLYDIGFDRPEAHAIRKENRMYFAYYAPEWNGKIELRGLDPNKTYQITDYENGKDMGAIRGSSGTMEVQFQKHLLLEAVPR